MTHIYRISTSLNMFFWVTSFFILLQYLCSSDPLLPAFPITYNMSRSTIAMACNYTGLLNLTVLGKFGLIDIDWSNGKELWANAHPMDAEETMSKQARILKSFACPTQCPSPQGCKHRGDCSTHVFVYRNLVKALPWLTSVREKLIDPQYSGFFFSIQQNYSSKSICFSRTSM